MSNEERKLKPEQRAAWLTAKNGMNELSIYILKGYSRLHSGRASASEPNDLLQYVTRAQVFQELEQLSGQLARALLRYDPPMIDEEERMHQHTVPRLLQALEVLDPQPKPVAEPEKEQVAEVPDQQPEPPAEPEKEQTADRPVGEEPAQELKVEESAKELELEQKAELVRPLLEQAILQRLAEMPKPQVAIAPAAEPEHVAAAESSLPAKMKRIRKAKLGA